MKFQKEKVTNDIFKRVIKKIGLSIKIKTITSFSKGKTIFPEHQLLLFSDPRGGSTWLAEILKIISGTALIWEPLHLRYIEHLKDLKFGWRQYIPEDFEWPEVKFFFEQVFSGKIVNEWTMSNTNFIEYAFAKYFIIKICRGNMMLPWITKNFSFIYRPIYLIRHPFGVVNSQMKQGGWNQIFRKYEIPDTPHNDLFKVHKDFLESLTSKEEVLTAVWCISNNVPLNHPGNNKKWITVYYEHLVMEPDKEIRRILSIWDIPFPDGMDKSYRKKSKTTKGGINFEHPEIQLSRWKNELTEVQILKMQRVLDYFSFKTYSYNKVTPIEENNKNTNYLRV